MTCTQLRCPFLDCDWTYDDHGIQVEDYANATVSVQIEPHARPSINWAVRSEMAHDALTRQATTRHAERIEQLTKDHLDAGHPGWTLESVTAARDAYNVDQQRVNSNNARMLASSVIEGEVAHREVHRDP